MKRKIIRLILRFLTDVIIKKYRPEVVAVTGSVGKTSAKEAIFLVLSRYFSARKSEKNLNTEIGLPLTFLGGVEAKSSWFLWLKNIFTGIKLILFKDKNYPRFVVVEMGADKPGDIKKLSALAKPRLAVVTAIGKLPVHVENYPAGISQLVNEKAEILSNLSKNDFAVLNFDDENVWPMKDKTAAKIISFGFNPGADVRITDYQIKTKISENGFQLPDGIFFRIEFRGNVVPIWLKQSLGKPPAYACAAAIASGLAFGLNLVDVGNAVLDYQPGKGRMRLLESINHSMILDDSYNAAPLAMARALETFKDLPAKRKICVLGDMLELGQYAPTAHEEVGEKAFDFCDLLFFVGQRMKFAYAKALNLYGDRTKALNLGFNKDKVFWFEDSDSAAGKLKNLLAPGDLILIKGSQGMRMELAVEKLLAHSETAGDLLVRQEPPWK